MVPFVTFTLHFTSTKLSFKYIHIFFFFCIKAKTTSIKEVYAAYLFSTFKRARTTRARVCINLFYLSINVTSACSARDTQSKNSLWKLEISNINTSKIACLVLNQDSFPCQGLSFIFVLFKKVWILDDQVKVTTRSLSGCL